MLWLVIIVVLLVILTGLVFFVIWSRGRFQRMVMAEVAALFEAEPVAAPGRFHHAMLEGLPEPIQRHLQRNVPEGAPLQTTCRLQHGGTFRVSPQAKWVPVQGEQYFTASPPQFIWRAQIALLPGLWIDARDKLVAGAGGMLIKPLSVLTLADDSGPALDQGALMRYMAEIVWLPTALLPDEHRRWEAIDAHTARLHITLGATTAWIDFTVNADGDITHAIGERYRENDPGAPLEQWGGRVWDYRAFDHGVRAPARIEAVWYLSEGDYAYARWDVTAIEYNQPAAF